MSHEKEILFGVDNTLEKIFAFLRGSVRSLPFDSFHFTSWLLFTEILQFTIIYLQTVNLFISLITFGTELTSVSDSI